MCGMIKSRLMWISKIFVRYVTLKTWNTQIQVVSQNTSVALRTRSIIWTRNNRQTQIVNIL